MWVNMKTFELCWSRYPHGHPELHWTFLLCLTSLFYYSRGFYLYYVHTQELLEKSFHCALYKVIKNLYIL